MMELTPIEQLMISLCRLEFSDELKAGINELISKITDWNEFIRISNEHGVIALCWYNITENGFLIPGDVINKMHSYYMKSLARNTAIFVLLKEMTDVASKEGIKIVLLKGLTLEYTVYGNKGLRQMNDLDILVKRDDAIRLRKAFLRNGFESMPMMSPLHEKILPGYGKHLPEMIKNGLAVEIHFRLFDQREEQLTGRVLETAKYNERLNAYVPDQAFHLLYLIKHLHSHEIKGTSQLRLYTDLTVMLENCSKGSVSDNLIALAASTALNQQVSEKIFILEKVFRVDLKSTEMISITDTPKAYIEKFIFHLRTPRFNNPYQKPEDLLRPMEAFKSFKEKIFFIAGYIFPSISFMQYRYKAKSKLKAIPYYPVRLKRFLELVVPSKYRSSNKRSKK